MLWIEKGLRVSRVCKSIIACYPLGVHTAVLVSTAVKGPDRTGPHTQLAQPPSELGAGALPVHSSSSIFRE